MHRHGASSSARAKALLAKALDRATESKRLRTPVNGIRTLPGAILPKARRRMGRLTRTRRAMRRPPPVDPWRDQSNVAGAIRAAYDRRGWQWASSHTGRRWWATSLLELGYGGRQVGELLGHESPTTTGQYARPRGAEVLRAGLDVVQS